MSVGDVVSQAVPIKLASGRELVLRDLSVLDFIDGEKLLGRPLHEWDQVVSQIHAFGVLLWLLARKEGVSLDDQALGKWAFPINRLLAEVKHPDVVAHQAKIVSFFGGSLAQGSNGSSPAASEPASPTASSSPSPTA